MKKYICLLCAVSCLSLTACGYNNYDRNSPYRGSVAFEHPDETVVHPQKTKTMTIKRDLTTTDGGTVNTRTVTETVTIPENVSDSEDYKKVQRDLNPDRNYIEVDVNKNYQYK